MKRTWLVLLVLLLLAAPAAVRGQFIFTTNADGISITITGYTGAGGAVTVPTNINGLTVTSIGYDAFVETSVTTVTIPGSVTSIGMEAFAFCTNLTNVSISESVTNIGYEAFDSCSSLTTVTIPDSVTSIETDTFSGCTALTNVTIPESVTNIEDEAFFDCTRLASVTIPSGVASMGEQAFALCTNLTTVNFEGNAPNADCTVFQGDNVTVYYMPETRGWSSTFACFPAKDEYNYTTNADNTITIIGYSGPGGAVTIPTNINGLTVTSIAPNAFDATPLTSVTIPDTVTNIGDYAFEDCTSLIAITVDTNNSFYSSVNGVLFDKGQSALIAFPDGVSGSFTIPDSTTTISQYAFWFCAALTSVTIPSSVTNIGDYAFGRSGLTSVTIPNSVTSIGEETFEFCTSLTNATIPGSVSTIGDYAFEFCGLSSVTISNGVTAIGSYAFAECPSLVSVTIPNSVTTIGDYAFAEDAYFYAGFTGGLTSVIIPTSVTNIGADAFAYCASLTKVTIPGSVTYIMDGVFYSCSKLTNATISNGVALIGDYAFGHCTSLTSVTIPASVYDIGDYAFEDCKSLTRVYFEGNAPDYYTALSLFYSDYEAMAYYLPGTTGWSGFSAATGLSAVPVISITVQPQSQTANAGATATFSVGVTSYLFPVYYQWVRNGIKLANGENISGATNSTLTIASVSDVDAGTYSALVAIAYGGVTTSNATLTVIDPPSIAAQPTNLLVLLRTNVAFGVTITGTPPFTYQWQFNGVKLTNVTAAIYTIPSVGTNNAGNYSVVVSNDAGSVTSSNAALTIVVSPTSQTNYAGSTATFSVRSFGPESLTYQWLKNGMNLTNDGDISGAINTTLTIANVSDVDAATYSAVVTNAYGSVTTSNATLTVNDSLFFAAGPLNQTVVVGGIVTFTATAYGAPPFLFQWFFGQTPVGSPTAGTNFSSLTLTNVRANQAGYYTVQVLNDSGSLTSLDALLTVIRPPTLSLRLFGGYPVVSLYGALGSNFVVQYGPNVAGANWIILLSITNLSASPYSFFDPSSVGQPARFYRAFMH